MSSPVIEPLNAATTPPGQDPMSDQDGEAFAQDPTTGTVGQLIDGLFERWGASAQEMAKTVGLAAQNVSAVVQDPVGREAIKQVVAQHLDDSGVGPVIEGAWEECSEATKLLSQPQTWEEISGAVGESVHKVKEKLPPVVRVHGRAAIANRGVTNKAVADHLADAILGGRTLVRHTIGGRGGEADFGSEDSTASISEGSSSEEESLRQLVTENFNRALDLGQDPDADGEAVDLRAEAQKVAKAASYVASLVPPAARNEVLLLGKNLGLNPTKALEMGGYPPDIAQELVDELTDIVPKEIAKRDAERGGGVDVGQPPPPSADPSSSSSSSSSSSGGEEELRVEKQDSDPAKGRGSGACIGAIGVLAIPMILLLGASIATYRLGGRVIRRRF